MNILIGHVDKEISKKLMDYLKDYGSCFCFSNGMSLIEKYIEDVNEKKDKHLIVVGEDLEELDGYKVIHTVRTMEMDMELDLSDISEAFLLYRNEEEALFQSKELKINLIKEEELSKEVLQINIKNIF